MLVVGENTFISIADADSFWAARNGANWFGNTGREAALVLATDYINSRYDWPGSIVDDTQALNWPRKDAFDCEGRKLEGIPKPVKDATAWLAGYALDNELFTAGGKDDIISRVKAGSVEVEWNAEETLESTDADFKFLNIVLSSIVHTNKSQVRLTRV